MPTTRRTPSVRDRRTLQGSSRALVLVSERGLEPPRGGKLVAQIKAAGAIDLNTGHLLVLDR